MAPECISGKEYGEQVTRRRRRRGREGEGGEEGGGLVVCCVRGVCGDVLV